MAFVPGSIAREEKPFKISYAFPQCTRDSCPFVDCNSEGEDDTDNSFILEDGRIQPLSSIARGGMDMDTEQENGNSDSLRK